MPDRMLSIISVRPATSDKRVSIEGRSILTQEDQNAVNALALQMKIIAPTLRVGFTERHFVNLSLEAQDEYGLANEELVDDVMSRLRVNDRYPHFVLRPYANKNQFTRKDGTVVEAGKAMNFSWTLTDLEGREVSTAKKPLPADLLAREPVTAEPEVAPAADPHGDTPETPATDPAAGPF